MRFSLKLFVLACVLAAMLVGYSGLQSQLHFMQRSTADHWDSFNGSAGYPGDGNGGIHFDGNGLALSAHVRSEREFALLMNQEKVCGQIASLVIFGEDTFLKFDPDKFPRVETIRLAQVGLQEGTLTCLQDVKNLKELHLAEDAIPMAAIAMLQQHTELRRLDIWSATDIDISAFPALSQLDLLVITSPGLNAESQELLRRHLPTCEVAFHEP